MKKIWLFTILYGIFILSGLLRLYNVNWDQGFHLHPDERAITLSVVKLAFPSSLAEFLSPDSPWNPKFFAYGSLPLYLLYVSGQVMKGLNPLLAEYANINLIGRYLSAFFDLGTVLFVFLIARRLLSVRFGLLAAFFYGISVLPIQLSHFYAVDTLLTFFITATLYLLLRYYETPMIRYALLVGMMFGAALATKISASVLVVSLGFTLGAELLLLFLKQSHQPHILLPRLTRFLVLLLGRGLLILLTAAITFLILEPYAVLDFPTFLKQTLEQSQMTKSAFTFPYTLQYVGKIPYVYEIKNILFFGLGPVLALLSFSGILLLTVHAIRKDKREKWAQELILVVFFWVYFAIVGSFAIGFMRYMLPVYPILTIAAAFFAKNLNIHLKTYIRPPLSFIFTILFFLSLFIWPLSFLMIYTRENTRVQASNWIHRKIPSGATLAVEHWDDALPLTGQGKYRILTFNLYDPDTPEKWRIIRQQLRETEYIILASNRLYTPLMKLTNCDVLPADRCYLETALYYQQLFAGSLGFTKVADITSYPTIPFTSWQINDQKADESFTVYDHPRVLIFKKVNSKN